MLKTGWLQWLPARIGTFWTKKGGNETALRYTLIGVSKEQINGEFCESRLQLFRNMTSSVLMHDFRSSIGANSLPAIYWSRYNTMYHLIIDHHVFEEEEFKTFLMAHKPSESYKRQVDKFRRDSMGLNEQDVFNKDAYHATILAHFDSNHDMTNKYLALEAQFLNMLDSDTNSTIPHLRDKFNAYNRSSVPYIQRATAPDIRNLSKSPDRFVQFCTTYSTPLTLLLTVSSGSFVVQAIQYAWVCITK